MKEIVLKHHTLMVCNTSELKLPPNMTVVKIDESLYKKWGLSRYPKDIQESTMEIEGYTLKVPVAIPIKRLREEEGSN